ncbi:MAG TPA: hypothetical protein VLM05_14985, partial [Mycobacteriales bacterium]|nr:hypothetical protein [Mycobacteriales bacterium]
TADGTADGTAVDGTAVDGAAVDGAADGTALDGTANGTADGTALDRTPLDRAARANTGGTGGLVIDGPGAARAARAYLAVAAPGTGGAVRTEGTTVVVVCRRTVRVPFGAVIARPHGIPETATARARTVVRPST